MFYETFSFYLASYIIFYIRIQFRIGSLCIDLTWLCCPGSTQRAVAQVFNKTSLPLCSNCNSYSPSPFPLPSPYFISFPFTLCAAQKFITAFLADSWRSWQQAQLYIPITYISNTYRQYGRDNNWLQAPAALAPCPHPLCVAADATLALAYNKFFVSGSVWRCSLVSLACLNLICNSAGIPCRQGVCEQCAGESVNWGTKVTSLLLKSYSSYNLNTQLCVYR